MYKILIIIVVAVLMIAGFLILNSNEELNVRHSEDNGKAILLSAPNFSLKDFNGNTVSLTDFKGKNLIINSWAVWCPFCVKELKDFSIVQKEFSGQVESDSKKNNGITIIAINRAESLKVAKEFTDKIGVTDDLIYLLDPSDSFYRSIGAFSMPETLFVDTNGKIVYHKRGPMPLDEIKERIKSLLND